MARSPNPERWPRPLALWALFLGPPTLWFGGLLVAYTVEDFTCSVARTGGDTIGEGPLRVTLAVIVLAALALVVVSSLLAWRTWRRSGGSPGPGGPEAAPPFLVLAGALLGVVFALGTLALGVPLLVFEACA